MIRGVDGRVIFTDDFAREDFVARFALLVRELGFLVLAWCLLGNHAHFVLQTGATPLAVLMARLNSRHAQRHNRTSDRRGHLFQDRYKAVLITTEGRLARDIAYALGNPVRHGLMSMRELDAYRFGGYSGLAGRRPLHPFESPSAVATALGVSHPTLAAFVRENATDPAARGAALEPDQIGELNGLICDCCRRAGVRVLDLTSSDYAARAVRENVCSIAAGSLSLPASDVARHLGLSHAIARRIYSRSPRG